MKSQRNQARSKRVPASRQKNPRIKIVKGLRVSYKFPNDVIPTKKWSLEQYENIKNRLKTTDRECIKVRKEYNLFKEIIPSNFREVSKYPKDAQGKNPENMQAEGRGVISPLCKAEVPNDTSRSSCKKPFLLPLDVQCSESIAQHLPSFKMIQSSSISLNIGFDTKFQEVLGPQGKKRFVLSLQMSIIIGETLIRYFFLVNPIYQEITSDGGSIPLKYCLADILSDLKKCYLPDFPLILRQNIKYKESKKSSSFKTVDFKEMSPWIIPVTLICHSGKGDLSIFRRSKYDTDFIRKACEIQKGLMTPEPVFLKAENDYKCNYYWLINLSIRDTQGLSPAASKSLTDLGNVIKMTKISLSSDITDYLAHFAVSNPLFYYQYAMNDADIVISYCSELFLRNRSIPITLSSAAASTMCQSIKDYLGVKSKAEYDRLYRGLELLDEGIVAEENENLKFLKATRYVPIKDNPDAKWISEFFEEAYTGGFNAALFLGWITEPTTRV